MLHCTMAHHGCCGPNKLICQNDITDEALHHLKHDFRIAHCWVDKISVNLADRAPWLVWLAPVIAVIVKQGARWRNKFAGPFGSVSHHKCGGFSLINILIVSVGHLRLVIPTKISVILVVATIDTVLMLALSVINNALWERKWSAR